MFQYRTNKFSNFVLNISIKVSSSNQIAINNFIKDLIDTKNVLKNQHFFFKGLKTKKQVFSLLKSPHVNKTAQENFCKINYGSKIIIYNVKTFEILLKLKSLVLQHPSVTTKIQFSLSRNKSSVYFDQGLGASTKFYYHTNKYLKFMDVYGEINNHQKAFLAQLEQSNSLLSWWSGVRVLQNVLKD